MDKVIYIVFLYLTCFPTYILSQTDYTWKQVIKESLGTDSLTILVLDYNSELPIDSAKIEFCHNKKLTFQTSSTGTISLLKPNVQTFNVSFEGYFSLCVALNNDSIDYITILLEKTPYSLPYYRDPKGYKFTLGFIKCLEYLAWSQARKDYKNNKVLLYTNFPINEEQVLVSKKYTFSFIKDSERPVEYRIAYNNRMLQYLEKKYGNIFKHELENTCWCNGY